MDNLMQIRCALYARVSTEEQAEKFGLGSQLTELREFVRRKGYVLRKDFEFLDEGYSGGDLDRPALSRLRDAARKGEIELVLVYDPDRLARKLAHQIILAEELEKARVRLEFITTPTDNTPEGRMFFNLKGVFAEYEKEKIRERTLRGRRQKAREGFIVGGRTPYGYRYVGKPEGEEGRYVVHEEEARVVRLIFQWIMEGLSVRAIVTRLNNLAIRPQRGLRWGRSSVHRILGNQAYAGTSYFNRRERTEPLHPRIRDPHRRNKKTALRVRPASEWIPIKVPAIVDPDIFERAAEQLKRNASLLSGQNTRYFYLLRGLLRCGRCGRKYVGTPSHGHRYYRCQGRDRLQEPDRCRVGLLHAERIEFFIWDTVEGILRDPSLLMEKLKQHHAALESEARDIESEVAGLERSLADVQRQEARALDAYLDEGIQLPVLKAKIEDLRARKVSLTEELERAKRHLATNVGKDQRDKAIRRYCRLASRGIEKLNAEARQRLLRAIIDDIVLAGRKVEIRGILPGRWRPGRSRIGRKASDGDAGNRPQCVDARSAGVRKNHVGPTPLRHPATDGTGGGD